MSSHFKYEIDERNLRLQLKENELSFTEEAWQKFENFSATQKSTVGDAMIKRFHVSLNRNVVLPVVFATVIILFSLLLFNFINIKNPAKEKIEPVVAKQSDAVVIESEVKPPATLAVRATSVSADQNNPSGEMPANTEPIENVVINSEAGKQSLKTAANEETVAQKTENETLRQRDVQVSDSNTAASLNTSASAEITVKKKRRVKREMIVTEPTQEEAEQLPPPPVNQTALEESPQ